MDQEPKDPVPVFISSHSADKALRDKLIKHLESLKRQGHIDIWYHDQLPPGTDLAKAKDDLLEGASVILLLISPDYIATENCYMEMERACQRSQMNLVQVIPILLRHVDLKGTSIASRQCLPRNDKPVKGWYDRDAVWKDIIREICRVIEDLNHLAVSRALPSSFSQVWNIPYRRNPFFTGREGELDQLHAQLRQSHLAAIGQIQAISGLGGIGKTQLAIEYAYRHQHAYQYVLWAHADSVETLNSSYIEIARLLGLPEKDAREQEMIVQVVKTWLQQNQRWLLILDNADRPALLPPFVPSIVGGHLLITTRDSDLSSLGLGIADPLAMQTFTAEQGILFLLHRSGLLTLNADLTQADPQEQALAKLLVQELGDLPLALGQAGAYLRATSSSLADYLQTFRQKGIELLNKPYSSEYPKSVATTWTISFQSVADTDPAAADLLRLCAFLAPDAIPEAILKKGIEGLGPVLAPFADEGHQLNQAIDVLRDYSLIKRDSRMGTLIVHRLVQAVLRDSLSTEDQQRWKQRAVQVVKATLPSLEHSNWTACEVWLPHASICDTWIKQVEVPFFIASHLLNWAGCYLRERAQYDEAKPFLKHALAISRSAHRAASQAEATHLNDLAYLYWNQGEYEEAKELFRHARAIQEGRSNYEPLNTQEKLQYAESLQSLACVYQTLGKYKEAEELLQLARTSGEQADELTEAIALSNLAELYRRLGKYQEANLLLKDALHIHEKQGSPERLNIAQILHKQALLSYDQGRYDEAEKLFKRTLETYKTCLGYKHPNTAQILHGLAEVYRIQRRYEEAEKLFKRALNILEQKLGRHSSTASVLNGLALLYLEQGKYIYVEQKGQKGYMKYGRYEEAKELFQQALEIREYCLGQEHPDTALSLHNLALLFYAQEQYKEAEERFQRALVIWQQQLSPKHPYIVHTLYHLGLLYQARKRYKEAEALFLRVLEIREYQFGQEHLDMVLSLSSLAFLYFDQKRYEEAEVFFQRILAIQEKQLGPEHPETQLVLRSFTSLLWAAGRDSETLLRKVHNDENALGGNL